MGPTHCGAIRPRRCLSANAGTLHASCKYNQGSASWEFACLASCVPHAKFLRPLLPLLPRCLAEQTVEVRRIVPVPGPTTRWPNSEDSAADADRGGRRVPNNKPSLSRIVEDAPFEAPSTNS